MLTDPLPFLPKDAFVIAIGTFLMVSGTYGSIVDIMDAYKKNGGTTVSPVAGPPACFLPRVAADFVPLPTRRSSPSRARTTRNSRSCDMFALKDR